VYDGYVRKAGDDPMKKIHSVSLGNAVIWGAVILAAAVLLRGTEYAGMMIVILGGAAGASISIVSNALRKNSQ
jgi:hypothetical protein